MIRFLLGIFCIFLFEITFAQKADDPATLSMNEAVIGRWGAFYPNKVRAVSWKDDQSFTFQKVRSRDTLFSCDTKTNKVAVMTTLKELNEATGLSLAYLPAINWLTPQQCMIETRSMVYFCDRTDTSWELKHKISVPKGENIHFHQKSMHHAFTRDNNVFIQDNLGGEKQVTRFKDPNMVAGQAIARSEFGITEGLFWSNTGAKLAFYQKDESAVGIYTLLDISTQPATNNTIKYPMAGQASEFAKLGIYDVATGKSLYLKVPGENDQYITNFAWGPNDKYVYIAVVNRAQNKMRLEKYLAGNGTFVKTLFEESHDAYVEPENPVYFLPDGQSFLWQSERDGYNHLYLYNQEGKLQFQVTKGDWVVKQILGVSQDQKDVYVLGTSSDGMSTYLYAASIQKMQKPVILLDEKGVKRLTLSKNNAQTVVLSNHATLSHEAYYTSLGRIKKKAFHQASDPFANKKMGKTKIMTLRDASDRYDLNARIIYPHDFDEQKKYPVLIYVYGGPHAQMVNASWMNAAAPWMHVFAKKGYIIATVDNRGSANRGFDFENVIHRQLGKAEMADQMQLVQWLNSQSYVDSDRLAVHGWSYGGYMTISLLLNYPEVFKVGIAGGPVTDWHMYEVMYGERYMDRPSENEEGYETTNLSNMADQLQSRLMMIHGTVDDVVVMQHSMQLVKAFVAAGKRVDFMPYPMHPHNVRGKDRVHLMETIFDYLQSNIDR